VPAGKANAIASDSGTPSQGNPYATRVSYEQTLKKCIPVEIESNDTLLSGSCYSLEFGCQDNSSSIFRSGFHAFTGRITGPFPVPVSRCD
jgi:hypothetical protein